MVIVADPARQSTDDVSDVEIHNQTGGPDGH
jgi:hypothetical protein